MPVIPNIDIPESIVAVRGIPQIPGEATVGRPESVKLVVPAAVTYRDMTPAQQEQWSQTIPGEKTIQVRRSYRGWGYLPKAYQDLLSAERPPIGTFEAGDIPAMTDEYRQWLATTISVPTRIYRRAERERPKRVFGGRGAFISELRELKAAGTDKLKIAAVERKYHGTVGGVPVKRRVEIAKVTPPVTLPEIPTKPDKPGGQTVEIDGEKYYIEGSTMYEMGWRRQSDYINSQKGKPFRVPVMTSEGEVLVTYKQAQTIYSLKDEKQARYLKKLGLITITPAKYKSMSPREQFEFYLEQGIIPEGSEFAPPITKEVLSDIRARADRGEFTPQEQRIIRELKVRDWAYLSPEQVEERAKILLRGRTWSQNMRALAEGKYLIKGRIDITKYLRDKQDIGILKDVGITDAQIKTARDFIANQIRFERTHVKPGAGTQWMTRKDYDTLPHRLQAAYDKRGMEGMDALHASVDADLKPYKGTTRERREDSGAPEALTYDIARFLRDSPDDEWKLKLYGFSEKAIDDADKYNKQPWVKESPAEIYQKALIKAGGGFVFDPIRWLDDFKSTKEFREYHEERGRRLDKILIANPGLIKLRDKAYKHTTGYVKPDISQEQFVRNYLEARGITPIPLGEKGHREFSIDRGNAYAEYARLYGKGVAGRSLTTSTAALLFSPARVMHPEVTFRDIRGIEWAIGAAQIVLIASPWLSVPFGAAARGVSLSLKGIAGLTFATATALSWKRMSPVERGISLALDVVIMGAILRGARIKPKGIKTTNTKARTAVRDMLKTARVDKVTISRVDQALNQIVKGIETNKPALIKKGEIALKNAMRSKTVPTRVRRMIADGGSYIRKNAVDYQRLIETTRRMNYRDITRAKRTRTIPDTRVAQQNLNRMVTLARDEVTRAKALQFTRLEQLRNSYLAELQDAIRLRKAQTVRTARLLAEREARIQAELTRLRDFGMTTNQERALLKRLDMERLRELASKATRVSRARRLQEQVSRTQEELTHLRDYGMTSKQQATLWRRLDAEWLRTQARKASRIAATRRLARQEAEIQRSLQHLKRTGMTPRQEATLWEKLDAQYRRSLSRKFMRIKEARELAKKEAKIQAELRKLKETGMTTRQQKKLWDELDRQYQAILRKKARIKSELDALDRMFERTTKTVVKESDATLKDIETYLKRKPTELTPLEGEPLTGIPPDKGRGIAVKEKTKPEVKTKDKVTTKVDTKPSERKVTTKVKTEQRRDMVRQAEAPITIAIAKESLAGLGLPIARPSIYPVPSPFAIPAGVPYLDPERQPYIEPARHPRAIPEIKQRPEPIVRIEPSPMLSPQLKPIPEVRPKARIVPELTTMLEPEPKPETVTTPVPVPGVEPEPKPEPKPKPETVTTPVPVPGVEPEPKPEPKPKPKPKPRLPGEAIEREDKKEVPLGSITWYQGEILRGRGSARHLVPVWKYIAPPWADMKPETLYAPPMGALRTDEKTAKGTIQMIGRPGAKVPETVSIDLGAFDIFIDNYGQAIEYRAGGEKTDVGERLPSPTVGMSLPAKVGGRVRVPSRPVARRKKVKKGRSRLYDNSLDTALQRMKY